MLIENQFHGSLMVDEDSSNLFYQCSRPNVFIFYAQKNLLGTSCLLVCHSLFLLFLQFVSKHIIIFFIAIPTVDTVLFFNIFASSLHCLSIQRQQQSHNFFMRHASCKKRRQCTTFLYFCSFSFVEQSNCVQTSIFSDKVLLSTDFAVHCA